MARNPQSLIYLYVKTWLATAPSGAETDNWTCLLASTGCTGAFAGHDGKAATKILGTWFFIPATDLNGAILIRHGVLGKRKFYTHDGTDPVGPHITRSSAWNHPSLVIAAQVFGA